MSFNEEQTKDPTNKKPPGDKARAVERDGTRRSLALRELEPFARAGLTGLFAFLGAGIALDVTSFF